MAAGGSASIEARRARMAAQEHARCVAAELARSAAFEVASRTEAKVAAQLEAMAGWGWRLLVDRRWSPGRSANIDMIHVGPGGVLVVDVKSWAEPDVVDGRLYRGQADAQDALDTMAAAADAVTDVTSELGLAPAEVVPVMVFVNQVGTDLSLGRVRLLDETTVARWAVRRGSRLTPQQVESVAELLDARFPVYQGGAGSSVSTVIPAPVLPVGRHQQPPPDTLFDVAAMTTALLEQARALPIEDWMTFLHPDQVALVRRLGPGPARIRGAAGTGKTVVALHRAVAAAELRTGPVLVTTFVKTLPPVLRNLYVRLSPATAGDVEFVNLHKWSKDLLDARGRRVDIASGRTTENFFARAWSRFGQGTALADVGVDWTYWRDEIDHVIKGRGLTDVENYRTLARVGRRTPLTAPLRELVWDVYCDYERQLRAAGQIDYNDLLSMALQEVTARPVNPRYAAVIADEVQDLNCLGVKLLAAISDHGSRLLLVGDGQQQIYPGGYTLAEAGLSVAGRSTVLRTNYRNGRAILAAANAVLGDDEFLDLDGAAERGTRAGSAIHDGGSVVRETAESAADLRSRALAQVGRLLTAGHPAAGIAILVSTNTEADGYRRQLARGGTAAILLSTYDGTSVDAVKVGTLQRAKGLEFKHVVHPMTSRAQSRRASDQSQQEQREREHRTLFVAMTRARDTLWIGRIVA